jgi:rubrerythrin
MKTKTEENLKIAFARESQTSRRYIAYARKADEEGFPDLAELFRSASEGEVAHALGLLMLLKEVRSTKDNLKAAIDNENYESSNIYPEFARIAKEEGNTEAAKFFEALTKAEKAHTIWFKQALEELTQIT